MVRRSRVKTASPGFLTRMAPSSHRAESDPSGCVKALARCAGNYPFNVVTQRLESHICLDRSAFLLLLAKLTLLKAGRPFVRPRRVRLYLNSQKEIF